MDWDEFGNAGQTIGYHHPEFGVNSRLDEIQAAVLQLRLERLPGWTERRRQLARLYRRRLNHAGVVVPPELDPGHVYHLFPVLVNNRTALMRHLEQRGIGSIIHYPVPIPRQGAFEALSPADCPVADRVSNTVCSLPLHPRLSDSEAETIAAAVNDWADDLPE